MTKAPQSKQSIVPVVVVAMLSFMGVLIETSMNVTFPALMRQFHVSLAVVQWVATGYLLTVALLMLTSAFLKKRFTNRQLFTAAALLFIVGDLLSALAPTFWILLVGRVIQAGCVGLTAPLMINIILDIVPRQKLSTYIGMANLIILLAPSLGPTFGGAMTAIGNWRLIFWTLLLPAIVLLFVGRHYIRQYAPTQKMDFDWPRFILLSLALISFILGLSTLGEWQRLWLFGLACVFSGILLALFLHRSKTSPKFLFNVAIFKRPGFLFSFLPYGLLQFANIGMNVLLPNYVQLVIHGSPFIGGLILFPGSLLNGAGQPFYGWLLDRYGGKVPLRIGNGLLLGAMLCFLLAGSHLTIFWIILLYLIFAIGRSMAFSNTMAFGLKQLSGDDRNAANALYNTGQQVFGAIGTTLVSVLMMSVSLPGHTQSQNVALGSQLAFCLIIVLSLLIFVCYHKLLQTEKKHVK